MTENPFELFGLPSQFALDAKELEARHRELSKSVHPDKHVGAGAGMRAQALSHAVSVNEAYRVLRDPLLRAEAVAKVRGLSLPEKAALPPAFLMDVMEQREALAEVQGDEVKLQNLLNAATARCTALETELASAFSQHATGPAIATLLAQLRYARRLAEEIDMKLEALDGAS